MSALPEEVRALFAGANVAHVATLTRDGAPASGDGAGPRPLATRRRHRLD